MDWEARLADAHVEHDRRAGREAAPQEREDLRLAGIAGASWAAGLAALMLGRSEEAARLQRRAADEYRVSWDVAPPGSWGRLIASMRCRLLAGDIAGARADAHLTLAAGALPAAGPIQGYAAVLALLTLDDPRGRGEAEALVGSALEPASVARALAAIAERSQARYDEARAAVLRSFEERDAFLEDVPVADTVLVLDVLARLHGLRPTPLSSPLLPR